MENQYSLAEARNHFSKIIRSVEKSGPITITNRGKPVAVLLSENEYEHLLHRKIGFWDALETYKAHVETLGLERNLMENLRDKSPGRDVKL